MLVEIEAGKKDVEGNMAEIAAREKAVEDGLLAYCFGVEAEREGSHTARAVTVHQ